MAMPTSTPLLRWSVFGGMAASMAGGLLLAFWPFMSADRQLQAFCRAQAAGTPQARVQALAEEQGYQLLVAPAGSLVVDDPGGFGRRQCTLALDAQGRVAAPR